MSVITIGIAGGSGAGKVSTYVILCVNQITG